MNNIELIRELLDDHNAIECLDYIKGAATKCFIVPLELFKLALDNSSEALKYIDGIQIDRDACEELLFSHFRYQDEKSLREAFEEMTEGWNKDDECMMNEAFNNWTDSLCKDGEIHQLQYESYTRV